jgi:hypothetical protein
MKHEEQKHVHELQGSVKIAEPMEDPHNHRFCTVTCEAIPCDGSHVHEVEFRTDFFEDHFHEFKGKTGPAVMVGKRHVHFIDSCTSVNDGHRHEFEAATLIENPIGMECRHEDNMFNRMNNDYMNMENDHREEHMRRNHYRR